MVNVSFKKLFRLGCNAVVELLPSEYGALSSFPSTGEK
jgi:hypothetical protein